MQDQNAVEIQGNGHHNGVDTGSVVPHRDGGGAARSSIVHELSEQGKAARLLIEGMRALVGEDDEMIETVVEGETNLHEALYAAMRRLAEIEALDSAIGDMIDKLKARKERFAKQADAIRTAMCVAMEIGEVKKLEFPIGTVSLRSVPPSVQIDDESAIPARFWKTRDPQIDKRELLKALKDETIPGASLSAPGTTISVRFA